MDMKPRGPGLSPAGALARVLGGPRIVVDPRFPGGSVRVDVSKIRKPR